MREQPFQKRRNNLIMPKEVEVEILEEATTGIRCFSKRSQMEEFLVIKYCNDDLSDGHEVDAIECCSPMNPASILIGMTIGISCVHTKVNGSL
ncbi:hypothetical protein TNCV_3453271 [Trichonephila clavipes]|nr:hypothetical protein TNCV_3453271 [Trichonephila clavipes]